MFTKYINGNDYWLMSINTTNVVRKLARVSPQAIHVKVRFYFAVVVPLHTHTEDSKYIYSVYV